MEVERCTIDGVDTLWAPDRAGEPLRATLSFRVGMVDETLPTAGITHLVEHLGLFRLGDALYRYNGSVELQRTLFTVEGQPDEVAGFLAQVCRSLGDLPLDRLEDERRVLRTEVDSFDPGVGARLFAMRFGLRRWGLTVCRQVGLDHLEGEAIARWARRWFTAGNAVLWLSGPPPEGLRLELPPGERVPSPPAEPLPELELPAYVSEGTGGVAVSGVVGERVASLTMAHLAVDRLIERLRRERGITYEADWWSNGLDPGRVHAVIGADCLDEHAPDALGAILRTLEELAGGEATPAELDRHREQARRELASPDVPNELDLLAAAALMDREAFTTDRVLRELEDVDPDAIAATARDFIDTAIVLAPSDVPMPAASRMRRYGEWSVPAVEGRRFAWRSRLRGRGNHLVVGPEGLTMQLDGEEATIRFERCVAAFRTPGGGLSVVADDDQSIVVDPADWRGAGEALEAIQQALPPDLIVDAPGLDHSERVETLAADLPQRWTIKGEIEALAGLLGREEELLALARWETTMKIGLLAMTDRRIMLLYDAGDLQVDEFAYAELDAIEAGGRGKVTLVRGDDERTIALQPRERAETVAQEAGARREALASAEPTRYF